MKRHLLGIFDEKVKAFLPGVITAQTRGEAERIFADVLRTPGNPISDHPEDYSMFELGTMEVESGIIERCKVDQEDGTVLPLAPVRLIDGVTVQRHLRIKEA